MHTVIS